MKTRYRFNARELFDRPTGPMGWLKRVAAIFLAALAVAAVIGIAIVLAITALSAAAIGAVIVAAVWGISRLFGRKRGEAGEEDRILVARRGPNGWEVSS
jgi:hypothetical protein